MTCVELSADWHALVDAAASYGRAILPMPYAYGAESTLTFSGTVFNAFVRLVKPLLASGKVAVRYDARALRLEWSPAKRRVDAVVFRDAQSGAEERLPCRAVVVAAGAVNTAEILLQSSRADFPDGLGNTHGVLGRYLHDHPLGKLVIDLGSTISVHPASYVTRASADRSAPLYAAACMQWSGAAIYARSMLSRKPGRLPWIGFSVFGTMAPTRDNFVALDPKRLSGGDRTLLELNISHPPEAVRVLDEARDQLVEVLASAGLFAQRTHLEGRAGWKFQPLWWDLPHACFAGIRHARRIQPHARRAERRRGGFCRVHHRSGKEPRAHRDGARSAWQRSPRARSEERGSVTRAGAPLASCRSLFCPPANERADTPNR